jgi:hypothetical protein
MIPSPRPIPPAADAAGASPAPRAVMRFELSMIAVGALATALLAGAGAHAYAAGGEEIALHLLFALGAVLAAALPHLWALFYLAGTRRALARATGAAAGGRRLAAAAAAAALAALAAGAALAATGARAYIGAGGGLHGPLFWMLLAAQPAALAVEWRALADNARRLARHGG